MPSTQTTIKVRPLNLTPTYNETIVVLESASVSQSNFKWIVDIYKGEPTEAEYELLSTIVILPNPDGYGVIDFHRHVENYITTSFFPADVDKISQKVTNEGFKWSFKVTEQYGTTEVEQTLSGSNVVHSFNGALSFQDFRNWDPFYYEMSNTSSDTTKFLIDNSNTLDVSLEDRVWVNNFMNTTYFRGLKIETDNGVFTVEQTFNPTGQHFINQNKIGPKDILESSDTFLTVSGSLPIVDLNTTLIKVTPLDALLTTAVGETITLNVKDYCSKHEAIRFFYMDKLGSYLPVTFNKVSKKNITNTRNNYRQNYGSYDSTSNSWGYTTYDRGTTNYNINTKEVITCTSDWMTEDQSKIVIGLLNSPNVYIQSSIGEYIAVNITTNTFEDKKTVNEKLINYTISFEHANTNTNQRG